MITPGDILAALDVLTTVIEESDSYEVDQAIVLMEGVSQLVSEGRRTIRALETQIKGTLEGGQREVGGRLYVQTPAGKWRTYHEDVWSAVIGQSVVDRKTGEIRDAKQAAQFAVAAMGALYVSPADEPKQKGLDMLGLDRTTVRRWENTGTSIEVLDLEHPEDA